MDERYREDKAKKHIDRLDFISDQMNDQNIHKEPTLDQDSFESTIQEQTHFSHLLFGFLFLFLLGILAYGYSKNGGLIYHLIPGLLLIGYLIYYRISIKSAKDKFDLLTTNTKTINNSKQGVINRLQVHKGVNEYQNTLSLLIRNQYVLFFPVLLVYLVSTFANDYTSQYKWVVLTFFVLGSIVFWWMNFQKEVDIHQSRIDHYSSEINTILASSSTEETQIN